MRRCFFASAQLTSGDLIIHGGQEKELGKPKCQTFLLKRLPDGLSPPELVQTDPDQSPNLSHHAAVLLEDRFFVVIGGWNGRKRSSEVFVLDLNSEKWSKLDIKRIGSAPPVGLSGHTANYMG